MTRKVIVSRKDTDNSRICKNFRLTKVIQYRDRRPVVHNRSKCY